MSGSTTGTTQEPDFFAEMIARKQKELDDAALKAKIDARSVGEQTGRDVRAFGTGLNDAIGNTVGAIPDAVGWGLRKLGLPSSAPDQYSSMARNALNSVGDTLSGGRLVPDTTAEKVLYGTGQGVGQAASFMVPAAAGARLLGQGGARMSATPWGTATSLQPGSATGNIAGQLAANPAMQLTAGGVGGGVEAATGSPTAGLLSSLAVPLGAGVFRGLVSPGLSQLNAEQARLAQVMTDEGVNLSAGQLSGSKPMRTAEAVFKELPFTAGPARAEEEARRVAFNKSALRRAGEYEADLATPPVIEGMLTRAWDRVSNIYARNNLTIDAPSWQRFTAIVNLARQDLGQEALRPIEARFQQLIEKMRPGANNSLEVPGAAYAELDSNLTKLMKTHGDPSVRDTVLNMRNTLRDSFAANVTGEEAQALADARRQYANGKAIQAVMNTPTQTTLAGHIPPAALSREISGGPAKHFAMGRGDLRDIAAGGQSFVQEVTPNSGTTQRALIQSLLTGSAFTGGLAGGRSLPMSAAIGATTLGLPPMLQSFMTSPVGRRYLTNQAAANMPAAATAPMFGAAATARMPGILDPQPQPIDAPRKQRYDYTVTP